MSASFGDSHDLESPGCLVSYLVSFSSQKSFNSSEKWTDTFVARASDKISWIRGSLTDKHREQRKGTSGDLRWAFSNDRTNQIITFRQWNLVWLTGLVNFVDKQHWNMQVVFTIKNVVLCTCGKSSLYQDSMSYMWTWRRALKYSKWLLD